MGVQAAAAGPGTTGLGARIFSVLSILLVLLVVVQIFVAGAGLFTMAHQLDNNQNYTYSAWNDSGYWAIHFFNAFAIALVVLLMLLVSFLAKMPFRTKRLCGVLVGLLVLQGVLGFIPWPAWIAALHVLNAIGILAVAGTVARENRAFGNRAA